MFSFEDLCHGSCSFTHICQEPALHLPPGGCYQQPRARQYYCQADLREEPEGTKLESGNQAVESRVYTSATGHAASFTCEQGSDAWVRWILRVPALE